MTEFNLHTAVIFLSTTLFPAAAIGYLAVMLYRIFRLKQVKGYWFGLLTAVSMCWVTGFLWQVGWIALKIWKL